MLQFRIGFVLSRAECPGEVVHLRVGGGNLAFFVEAADAALVSAPKVLIAVALRGVLGDAQVGG